LPYFNADALKSCARINESCVKAAFKCEEEASISGRRADLKCGDIYVEVEPLNRLECGLGQVLLWRLSGVEASLFLFGEEAYGFVDILRALAATYSLDIYYFDVINKFLCKVDRHGDNICVFIG
jgi:hypothetical protein